jgi:hypothetical protein
VTIKLNFYDIYGFALPGFLLLAVLWLPFGLIEGKWPDAQLSSALVAIIFAYFVGHILQTVATNTIPTNFVNERYPSSVFLDNDDPDFTFSQQFKDRLAEQIRKAFGLDVKFPANVQPANLEDVSKKLEGVRRDAFFLCRSALIKSKTIVYAEQFEGLYALMRGLTTGFGLGVFYYLGWAASGLLQSARTMVLFSRLRSLQWSGLILLVGLVIAIVVLINAEREFIKNRKLRKKYVKAATIASLALAVFATGYYLGLSRTGTYEHRAELLVAAVFSFFAAERSYAGYKAFAKDFAKAVYRDFSNCQAAPAAADANELPPDNNDDEDE